MPSAMPPPDTKPSDAAPAAPTKRGPPRPPLASRGRSAPASAARESSPVVGGGGGGDERRPPGRRNSLPTALSGARGGAAVGAGKAGAKDNPTLQMKWDQMYARLLTFRERHGHCLVPNRFKEDRSLGQWVSAQRRQYKQMQSGEDTPMTPERARLLESINFVWATLERGHMPWEVRYKELTEYKRKYGDCLVPVGFKENSQLSSWVSTQRQEMKLLRDGRPTRLTEERIRLLNEVGFVWESQRGKRGGRKKRKVAAGEAADEDPAPETAAAPASPQAARPSHLVARVVTDTGSESSLASYPGAASAYHHNLAYYDGSRRSPYPYAYAGGELERHRADREIALPPPPPPAAPYAAREAAVSAPADDIFADADEEDGDDARNASAVQTYYRAQRKRPQPAARFEPASFGAVHGGPAFRNVSPVPVLLGGRGAVPESGTMRAAGPAFDDSKEEAAAALLSFEKAAV